jgi:colanic acid biosynthesis glycosyl transferase WcaI
VKIAIVSQYYRPENAKITNSLAAELADRGHSVRVVTGYPNFPGGVLYPGYKQRWRSDELDGEVRVRRVPIVVSHSANPLGRIVNYVSFAFSSLQATKFISGADVVYVYATQMTASIAPFVWSKTRRMPFVLHVQDLWPESITGSALVSGKLTGRLIHALLTPWLRSTYKAAAATIAIAPTMAAMLKQRGVPADRLSVVYNWSDDEAGRLDTSTRDPRFSLTVSYAGNVGNLQALDSVIAAAHAVRDLDGFRLLIVGDGGELKALKRRAVELGVTNVVFRGRVEPSQMTSIYGESDFQLISLKNLDIFHGTIPSKFQASLAKAQPVICAVPGDLGVIVRREDIGFTAEPENVGSIADAFRRAFALTVDERSMMADRASAFYSKSMTTQAGVSAVEQVLLDAARQNRRRT